MNGWVAGKDPVGGLIEPSSPGRIRGPVSLKLVSGSSEHAVTIAAATSQTTVKRMCASVTHGPTPRKENAEPRSSSVEPRLVAACMGLGLARSARRRGRSRENGRAPISSSAPLAAARRRRPHRDRCFVIGGEGAAPSPGGLGLGCASDRSSATVRFFRSPGRRASSPARRFRCHRR